MKLLTYLQQTHGLSRRLITDLIKQHELMLNGMIVIDYLCSCSPGDQYILTRLGINGKVTHATQIKSEIILFNKPIGYTVAKYDRHNETIFDILPTGWRSIYYPIGRLDKDSCGLLLMTNNIARVHELTHPSFEHSKIYHVLIDQPWKKSDTAKALGGILVYDEKDDNEILLACDSLTPIKGGIEIVLHEGKNRHIRKMLTELGYTITQLRRMSFCGIELGDLAIGEYQIQSVKELSEYLAEHQTVPTIEPIKVLKTAGQGGGNL